MYLGYENFDSRFSNQRFDHLITGIIWKSQGDNNPRKYDYSYDNAGRLTAALFTQKNAPSDAAWTNTKADFSESDIEYDENGNLKKLYRKGILPGNNSPLYIDKLNFTYKQVADGQWSNQLLKVFDDNPSIGSTANGKLGDFKDEVFNSNTDDYIYDYNGNLVTDQNKKIRNGSAAGITYNILDKPEKIILENKSTVEFVYDATGNKLAKKVTTQAGSIKTTLYIGEFIYENDVLQFILHEEGRLRVMTEVNQSTPLGAAGQEITGNIQLPANKHGVYEYFIKDHQGSTRMVLTEEKHKEVFKCTMEIAARTEEEQIFGKVDNNGNPAPGNEVVDTRYTQGSNSVSKLFTTSSSSALSVGPNVLLKVMAGDNISGQALYHYDAPGSAVTNNNILNTIANSIIGGFIGGDVSISIKDGAAGIQNTLQDPTGPLLSYMNTRPTQDANRPRGYLNYVFFDENFNYVEQNSSAVKVKPDNGDGTIAFENVQAPKNGYVYVYLSNESEVPVLFDDFNVSHVRGAIIEESHYYAHGLKMSGISARAFNKMANKYGFQGDFSEEEEESGYDEFDLRTYDPQIGRWIQTDPYDEFASGYAGMGNNPANNMDPSGGSISAGFIGAIAGAAAGVAAPYLYEWATGDKVKAKGAWAALGAFAGAGIGYGVGETLAGNSSLWLNIRAFYEGLFGGGDGYVRNNNWFSPLHEGALSAEVPDIWNRMWKSLPPFVDFTPSFIFDVNPVAIGGIVRNTLQFRIPTPPFKPIQFNRPPPARRIQIRASTSFLNSPPPVERSLSREQIRGANAMAASISAQIANAIRGANAAALARARANRTPFSAYTGFNITIIRVVLTYPSSNPLSTVTVPAAGSVYVTPGGTRMDNIGPGDDLNRLRPIDGAGFTPAQNLEQQARNIGIQIARRLGVPGARIQVTVVPGTTYRSQSNIGGSIR